MFEPVRPGMFVEDDGQVAGLGHRFEVLIVTFLGRLVVIGADHKRAVGPGLLGELGQAHASRVELEPVPAITLMRFVGVLDKQRR